MDTGRFYDAIYYPPCGHYCCAWNCQSDKAYQKYLWIILLSSISFVCILSLIAAFCIQAFLKGELEMYQKGRAWIELNIDNLVHNISQFKNILFSRNVQSCPQWKANAYGHGAVIIAEALQDFGIKDFCVATVNEAVELREAGISGQLLILGYTSPKQFSDLVYYNLTQTVVDYPYAKLLNDYGQAVSVHIGIDTGMHRLGKEAKI